MTSLSCDGVDPVAGIIFSQLPYRAHRNVAIFKLLFEIYAPFKNLILWYISCYVCACCKQYLIYLRSWRTHNAAIIVEEDFRWTSRRTYSLNAGLDLTPYYCGCCITTRVEGLRNVHRVTYRTSFLLIGRPLSCSLEWWWMRMLAQQGVFYTYLLHIRERQMCLGINWI